MRTRVLAIAVDEWLCSLMVDVLEPEGYQVVATPGLSLAVRPPDEGHHDLALVDALQLVDASPVHREHLRRLVEGGVPVVALVDRVFDALAHDQLARHVLATICPGAVTVPIPFDVRDLLATIREVALRSAPFGKGHTAAPTVRQRWQRVRLEHH